jgi:hypothetical protein
MNSRNIASLTTSLSSSPLPSALPTCEPAQDGLHCSLLQHVVLRWKSAISWAAQHAVASPRGAALAAESTWPLGHRCAVSFSTVLCSHPTALSTVTGRTGAFISSCELTTVCSARSCAKPSGRTVWCQFGVACCMLHVACCMLHVACSANSCAQRSGPIRSSQDARETTLSRVKSSRSPLGKDHSIARRLTCVRIGEADICRLHVVRCMLSAACCLLHVVCCMLSAACCLLHVV